MIRAEIYITLKKTVLDPQGLTIKHALQSMGYQGLKEVRIGKLLTLKLNHQNSKKTKQQIEEMCKKLLANPIIEDYRFKIKEE